MNSDQFFLVQFRLAVSWSLYRYCNECCFSDVCSVTVGQMLCSAKPVLLAYNTRETVIYLAGCWRLQCRPVILPSSHNYNAQLSREAVIHKVKLTWMCIALRRNNLASKVLIHRITQLYLPPNTSHTCLYSQPQSITALWPVPDTHCTYP